MVRRHQELETITHEGPDRYEKGNTREPLQTQAMRGGEGGREGLGRCEGNKKSVAVHGGSPDRNVYTRRRGFL